MTTTEKKKHQKKQEKSNNRLERLSLIATIVASGSRIQGILYIRRSKNEYERKESLSAANH